MNEDDSQVLELENLLTDSLEQVIAKQKQDTPTGCYAVIVIPLQLGLMRANAIYVNNDTEAHTLARDLSKKCGELTPDGRNVARPELFNFRRIAVYDSFGKQLELYTSGKSYTEERAEKEF